MKVALLHHWLNGIRGGEKVFEIFCEMFPEADVFTLFYDKDKTAEGIKKHRIFPSKLNSSGFLRKNYTNLFMLFPFYTEQFDLTAYDLIISSDTISMKGVITSPDVCHICYCHTPPRYVWDRYFEYIDNAGLGRIKKIMARYFLHKYRQWDMVASNRVDYYIANSNFVARRIAKVYRRKSFVLNPPINFEEFKVGVPQDYYLTLGQLVPYKRIDLVIEAFNRMPDKKLIVAGSGPNEKMLKKMAGKNIIFKNSVDDSMKQALYMGCKAFIFPGIEDYGITPLEAQACGRPVIAFGCGGILDTVKGVSVSKAETYDPNSHTGLFFDEQSADAIEIAVTAFEKNVESSINSEVIRGHAEGYDKKYFVKKCSDIVSEMNNDFKRNGPPVF